MAKVVTLTTARIRSWKPAKAGDRLRDSEIPGFAVHAGAQTKSYYLSFKYQGRKCTLRIGRFPDLPLKRARELAREARAKIAEGVDPRAERRAKRAAPTMADLWVIYERDHAPKKKSADKDRQRWRDYVQPALGRLKVADVGYGHVSALHTKIGGQGKPGAANQVLSLLSTMFKLAEQQGMIPRGSNPARGVKKFPGRKIERFLTAQEYVDLFEALDAEADTSPDAVAAIKLIALSGMRAREPLQLQRKDVDFDRARVFLAETKTGPAWRPVSEPALEILRKQLGRRRRNDALVFRGKHDRGSPLPSSAMHSVWCRVREAAGLDDVRLHDLRHSFASMGADQGLTLTQVGDLLGHGSVQATARYVHLFQDGRRESANLVGKAITAAATSKSS